MFDDMKSKLQCKVEPYNRADRFKKSDGKY